MKVTLERVLDLNIFDLKFDKLVLGGLEGGECKITKNSDC